MDTPLTNVPGAESAEERKALASELSKQAAAWEEHRAELETRWARLEKMHLGEAEMPAELPWDGAIYRNIPVLKSKARAWMSYVCGSPTQAAPYLVGTIFGKEALRAKDIETDFYLFMRDARWTRYFRRNTQNTGLYGKGIWRVRVEIKDRPKFCFEAVRPRAFLIYPNIEEGIEACQMVGHQYEESSRDVKAKQASGEYYSEPKLMGKTERKNKEEGGAMDETKSIAVDEPDRPIRLYEAIRRFVRDGEEYWYRVRFAPDDQELLAIYDYPYSRPWYFDQFVHEEQGRFWPETSRYNDIQDLQLATNDQWNQMQWGSQMSAFPTTFAQGWSLPQKYARTKPGTIVPLLNGGAATTIQSRYDPSVSPLLLQDLDKRADLMMQLGQQQQAATSSDDQTATASNIRQNATNTAINDDLANIDECIAEIGDFMQELYLNHYVLFLSAYGQGLAVQDPSVLEVPVQWELLGKSPATTPQAQQQQAQALTQSLIAFNPETIMVLQAAGINVPELIKTLVKNSSLDNRDLILMQEAPNADPNLGQPSGIPGEPGMGMDPGADPLSALAAIAGGAGGLEPDDAGGGHSPASGTY